MASAAILRVGAGEPEPVFVAGGGFVGRVEAVRGLGGICGLDPGGCFGGGKGLLFEVGEGVPWGGVGVARGIVGAEKRWGAAEGASGALGPIVGEGRTLGGIGPVASKNRFTGGGYFELAFDACSRA